jgi:hypothetical protein
MLSGLALSPRNGRGPSPTTTRAWGVRVVDGLQTLSQLDAWPNGKALKSQWPATAIFDNSGDIDLMREVSAASRSADGFAGTARPPGAHKAPTKSRKCPIAVMSIQQ